MLLLASLQTRLAFFKLTQISLLHFQACPFHNVFDVRSARKLMTIRSVNTELTRSWFVFEVDYLFLSYVVFSLNSPPYGWYWRLEP